jgi:hypothetical protein
MNVVFFPLVDSLSSKFFLFTRPIKTEQSFPKRRHIKFGRRGITKKNTKKEPNT